MENLNTGWHRLKTESYRKKIGQELRNLDLSILKIKIVTQVGPEKRK